MVAPGSDDRIVVTLSGDIGARVAAAAREQHRTPNDIVLEACRRHLALREHSAASEQYARGYQQTPENPSDTEALLPDHPLASAESAPPNELTPDENGLPLASFIGSGKGSFASADEADAFIRSERDAWEC